MAPPVPQPAPLSGLAHPVKGAVETILVVEGAAALPSAAGETLQALGYRVLRATSARAALRMLETGDVVDLLFMDGDGPDLGLAARARELRPDIALLCSSASSRPTLAGDLRPESDVARIASPYRPEELARTIRHALGNQQQVNALARALRDRAPDATTAPRAQALAVLLVEDQDDVRDTSRELLELLGCEVEAVASAEAAAAALRQYRFDVLLTDITLPGRSGVELAREAAQLQSHLTVVVSSGHGSVAGLGALKGLAVRSLPKPYGVAQLEALLHELRGA